MTEARPAPPSGRSLEPDDRDADRALRLVQSDPHAARRLAARALTVALARGDRGAASTAQRAIGLAARELGELPAAGAALRLAIRIAEAGGLPKKAAQARMSLSMVLAYQGRGRDALLQVDLAAGGLRGPDAHRVAAQRALVLQVLGRLDEAERGYAGALPALRRTHDELWEARSLNNLGVLQIYGGRFGAAESNLRRAERLYAGLDQDLAVADVRGNLGFLYARRGDVPAALAEYDRVDEYYAAHDLPRAHVQLDRCDVLLSALLIPEARVAAGLAVEELARQGRSAELAEARLTLSRVAILEGDLDTALAAARQAGRAFAAQRRPGWHALARMAATRAIWLSGERSLRMVGATRRAVATLDASGWVIPALDARLLLARLLLDLGRSESAEKELRAAGRAGRTGPAELRVRAWHATALLRLARGDGAGAGRALRAGLRVLDQHRAALGATELRAQASGHGTELALLGLRLAVETGDAHRALGWTERWRANALRLRPARPPDDEALAADLAELRGVMGDLEEAGREGRSTTALLRRMATLEGIIRRRTLRAAGKGRSRQRDEEDVVRLGPLSESLEDAVLVSVFQLEDRILAVTVEAGRSRLHRLGRPADVGAELDAIRFSLRRLARAGPRPVIDAAVRSAAHAAARLDELILSPVRSVIGERPLVISPPGLMHALPWSMLPTLSGRPFTVTPSATAWWRSARESRGRGVRSVALVAGPGLPGAAAEVAALRRRYPGCQSFPPARAQVAPVLRSLEGADLAHVAAHGRFRHDNPLFSSLRMADGPLTVYDLERLERAPATLVLSACESGLSSVRPGDELMGLASALFALGTASLVASVVPVPDEETRPFMLEVHRWLRRGSSPSVALARARSAWSAADPRAEAAAGAFVCLGLG